MVPMSPPRGLAVSRECRYRVSSRSRFGAPRRHSPWVHRESQSPPPHRPHGDGGSRLDGRLFRPRADRGNVRVGPSGRLNLDRPPPERRLAGRAAGALGIAFDPAFASNHSARLCYTNPGPGNEAVRATPGEHNQLSWFTVDDSDPNQPVFKDEAPIVDWNNLDRHQPQRRRDPLRIGWHALRRRSKATTPRCSPREATRTASRRHSTSLCGKAASASTAGVSSTKAFATASPTPRSAST